MTLPGIWNPPKNIFKGEASKFSCRRRIILKFNNVPNNFFSKNFNKQKNITFSLIFPERKLRKNSANKNTQFTPEFTK